MINLLPPATKRDYRYATKNTSLLRWVVGLGAGLALILVIGAYGWLSMRQAILSSDAQAASVQQSLEQAQLASVNQQVKDISGSFKLAEKVLSQQILFSGLLRQMATALPTGTYLSSLNIPQVSSGSALDVTVDATDYNAATQVQINLADPDNEIFARADIQNISCDASNASNPRYPCKITLRAQFANNNQFLFVNQKAVVR